MNSYNPLIPPTPQWDDFRSWKRGVDGALSAMTELAQEFGLTYREMSAQLAAQHAAIAVLARQLPDPRRAAAEYLELMEDDEGSADPAAAARLRPAFQAVHDLLLREMNRRADPGAQ